MAAKHASALALLAQCRKLTRSWIEDEIIAGLPKALRVVARAILRGDRKNRQAKAFLEWVDSLRERP